MPVRRVVTGHDGDGNSRVESDVELPEGLVWHGKFDSLDDWVDTVDATSLPFDLSGPPAGFIFQVDRIPPDAVMKPLYGAGGNIREVTGNSPRVELDAEGFHSTTTVDLLYIVDGELTCEFDTGSVKLGPGDTLIQRGTRHAWRNAGTEPVMVIAVLLNTLPAETEKDQKEKKD
ncbi:cupin domain-containing protein [Streptomyces sp. NPDC059009]|uniref:cupin domain-containing protein n=1 Tax=Streptomyces sp. NPDC059009 TaxID=3346694 RepID=UPI0036A76FB9